MLSMSSHHAPIGDPCLSVSVIEQAPLLSSLSMSDPVMRIGGRRVIVALWPVSEAASHNFSAAYYQALEHSQDAAKPFSRQSILYAPKTATLRLSHFSARHTLGSDPPLTGQAVPAV